MNKIIERISNENSINNHDHYDRYIFAVNYIEKNNNFKNIVDCACGNGYGSNIIATKFSNKNITGIDIDKESIECAKNDFNKNNLLFINNSLFNLSLENKADVFISFETIEHVDDPELFLKTIYNNLSDSGVLLLSTPNGKITCPWKGKPRNKFHKKEYEMAELLGFVKKNNYKIIDIYGQYPKNKISIFSNFLKSFVVFNYLISFLYKIISNKKTIQSNDSVFANNSTNFILNKTKYSSNLIIIAKK